MSNIAKAVSSAASSINVSKLTSAVSSATKKVDLSSITSSLSKTTSSISSSAAASLKKADISSTLKKFDNFPGASTHLKSATAFVADNPKLVAAGVTGTAAAGFIAFQVANGKTLEEAFGELEDLVGDGVELIADKTADVVSSSAGIFGGIAGSAFEGLAKGLLGENYKLYLSIFAVIFVLVILLKIKNMFN